MSILSRCLPKTVENRAALRTATTVLVTILIAFKLHMVTPYWAGMTAVILSNLYTGSIIDKAMLRIIGTIAGAWIGYYAAGFVVNDFYFYLLVCFLLVAVAMYYYNISRYAYAYLLGGITTFLIISQLAINPGNAFYVAVWRSAEISLGVIVSAISAFCLFPNHIKDSALEHIDLVFTEFLGEIDQLQQFICDKAPSLEAITASNLKLRTTLKKTTDMIDFMRHEVGIKRAVIDRLRALLNLLYGLARKLNYFLASQQHAPISGFACEDKLPIHAVFNAIREDLTTLKSVFISGKGTHSVHCLHTGKAMEALNAAFVENRQFCAGDLKSYYSIYHLLQQINEVIINLGSLLIDQQMITSSNVKMYSRAERLQNDPDVIKHSIKVGCSVVLAMLIWLFSSWPGGLNGIVSSIVISIRKNIFDMKNISLYRLLGCVLGGGSALVILSMVAFDVYTLAIVLFFLVWAFSYFSFKYTQYAYIGLQANIALVITLAQEGGPPTYLGPPLERLGGIVIGIVASFIVANILWRSSSLSMLEGRLRKLSRFLVSNIQQVLTLPREDIVLHDITNLFWVCRGLLDSLSLEQLSPRKQMKFEVLKQAFEAKGLVQATLRYIYESINRADAIATAKLLDVDLTHCESSIKTLYQEPSKAESPVIKQLDDYIAKLEANLTPSGVTNEQLTNLLAYLNALRQLAMGR